MSCIGIAGDGALLEDLPHALLDRRDEVARDHAADDGIDELEAGAALHGLDP
jgi:hypothetical protein